MAGEGAGQRTEAAARGWPDRVRQWWLRARGTAGYERYTLLQVLKSTLAATLAWVVSYYLLDSPSPAFAPFSAVLIMQVTVYQSLLQSLRYLGAVAVGVAMVAALGFLSGPDLLTFVLVALAGLTIGRWPALGAQGPQVSTAAFFAFSTYASATSATDKVTQLGQIILLVLIGCTIGVVVNVTVAPPMRYRSAEYGIRSLSTALDDLVSDMYPALRDGELDEERLRQWHRRAEQTGGLITQAKDGFNTAQESLYFNPRRLLRRYRGKHSFEGYGAVLAALERSLYQVSSLTRSLHEWHEEEGSRYDDGAFLRGYADFLESVSKIAEVLGELDEDSLGEQARQLCRLADEARERCRRVSDGASRAGLPLADPARPYGVLVVEATRLMEEFQHCCDVLQRYADQDA
ncbi:aromatic acid exporter family protein [Streptomyces longisporoflavus]|uniref:Aromatic acid exporter family protein n=1 Tax=Streptomyces longisporoflavus TaxID=28044 RepID=A0ABW7QGV6_9ACTN